MDQLSNEEKYYDRPLFLSCLCILTWVGSWFILLYYAIRLGKLNSGEGELFVPDHMKIEYELMKISIVAAVISGFGAYLMWHQRRAGLFVYLFGQLLMCAFGLFVYLVDKPMDVPETYYYVGFYVVQLGFVALYSLNWKVLNNTR
ncbi:MAG: hypothetical protein V4604_02015 [Bacteroidota bacterium]